MNGDCFHGVSIANEKPKPLWYTRHMEFLDILDEKGQLIGEVRSRKEAHEKGLWHKCTHIWIQNSKGEILLQKRSMQKASSPGNWDISVAGHLQAGQKSIEGALREIEEEIGQKLKESELVFLGTVKEQSVGNNGAHINNQFDDIYLVRLDIDPSTIVLQKEEVDEVKFIPAAELLSMIDREDPSLVRHPKEYELLRKYL